MLVNLLIAEDYTPKPGYDKISKNENIRKLQEEVDAQMVRTLQESQNIDEGADLDPHVLSREQNDQIIENVFGPSKKGRRRFRRAGAWTKDDTTTSEPTMSSPPVMQQSNDAGVVHNLISLVTLLVNRIDAVTFFIIVAELYAGISNNVTDALTYVVFLAGKISTKAYVEIVQQITFLKHHQVEIFSEASAAFMNPMRMRQSLLTIMMEMAPTMMMVMAAMATNMVMMRMWMTMSEFIYVFDTLIRDI